jgi:cytochrome c oxidase subunit I+III
MKLHVVAWLCGLTAIAGVLAWLWQSDQPPPQATARVSDRLRLPVNAAGPASQSWWATLIMLVVDAMVFASFLFAFIHLSMRLDICPPAGAALPQPLWPLLSSGLLAAGSLLIAWARRAVTAQASQHGLRFAVVAAAVCATAAFAAEWHGQLQAGLAPSSQAWSAAVAAMLSYQGLHVLVLLLIAPYLLARSWSGRLGAASRATIDNCALIWHYTTLQGLVFAAAVNWLPRLMG